MRENGTCGVLSNVAVSWPVYRVEIDPARQLDVEPWALDRDIQRDQRPERVVVLRGEDDVAGQRIIEQRRVDRHLAHLRRVRAGRSVVGAQADLRGRAGAQARGRGRRDRHALRERHHDLADMRGRQPVGIVGLRHLDVDVQTRSARRRPRQREHVDRRRERQSLAALERRRGVPSLSAVERAVSKTPRCSHESPRAVKDTGVIRAGRRRAQERHARRVGGLRGRD